MIDDMNSEIEIFREKARKGFVCQYDGCPKSGECLIRMLADYVPADNHLVQCVNPAWVRAKGECGFFRPKSKVRMGRGLMGMFDDLPYAKAIVLRKALIATFTRKGFYAMRNGTRLISPEEQQVFASVFKSCGIAEAPRFDSYVDEYWWL